MRWSKAFFYTKHDESTEAETISHKLMLRSGLIHKLSAGVYSYLPFGFLILNKVISIVREEMNKAGAQEIHMPVLQPPELWEETKRLDTFGDLMFKVKDRNGKISVLGPTHEEVVIDIVRNYVNSYRQLPIILYQIQTKFRDEIRPRFGVIRGKEFLMKDGYSFDRDIEGLNKNYETMYSTYCNIFKRCGLKYVVVEAESGLMGGDVSHEFVVPCSSGEDQYVICQKCGWAINKEKAPCVSFDDTYTQNNSTLESLKEVETPNCSTVEEVSKFLAVKHTQIVKTLIYKSQDAYLAVLVRGDYEVNTTKLMRLLGTTYLKMAGVEEIEKTLGSSIGFSGPVGLGIKIIADYAIKGMVNFVTGSNRKNYHLINVNYPRDFTVDIFADIRQVVDGDHCPKCKGNFKLSNGIEVGHIFKLGTKYSENMSLTYQDEKEKSHLAIMGCYGIGIDRIIAAAIESSHDEKGIILPKEIAPFSVIIISINPKNTQIAGFSEKIYEHLKHNNIEVLWDDRDLTAGVKFKDADLIGIPIRIVVGKKTIDSGLVDIKSRNSSQEKSVSIDSVVKELKYEIENYKI